MRLTPTFADHDLPNLQTIVAHEALNSGLGGRQILYGERYFPDMVMQMEIEEGPTGYNSLDYDGYMYYQEMPWKRPSEFGETRGLFQSIP